MPYSPAPDDYRNQITDALMPSRADKSPLAQTMAALPQNMPMATGMPTGMPQTPAGGVPGSGIAPAGGSIMPTAPVHGMTGPMQPMAGRGVGGAPTPPMLGGLGQIGPMPTPGGVDASGMMPGVGLMQRGRVRGY